ncbi:unnamed protein product [Albugo candida]|uniref:Uncharacterized protein n=1 Tax=Albugo candida TaxID=65357 RepID=A0A024G4V4_9STRA|nr:unnamed protein product [Albugo candida]|eukprot:CCI41329.1 unnamed protein product [Albugo candida]
MILSNPNDFSMYSSWAVGEILQSFRNEYVSLYVHHIQYQVLLNKAALVASVKSNVSAQHQNIVVGIFEQKTHMNLIGVQIPPYHIIRIFHLCSYNTSTLSVGGKYKVASISRWR